MNYYQQRVNRAQTLLQKLGLAAVLVTTPPNFYFFTGKWLDSHERLQALIIKQTGSPVMLVHEMAKEQVKTIAGVEQKFWQDGDDAIGILKNLLPPQGTVAVDNNWPSANLLQLMSLTTTLSFRDSTAILGQLRLHKDELEVKLLLESGRAADGVMEKISKYLRPGLSEQEAAIRIKEFFEEEGAPELSFPTIVATGPNSGIPHHETGDRVIEEQDIVLIDMGGIKNYYCSDMTRTFVLGEPEEEFKEIYEVVRLAQDEAVKKIRPGIAMQEIDLTARGIIEKAGFGPYFTHRTGHGLGIEVHEEPFLTPTNSNLLEEGMVVSVEPGIYLPDKFGVRIEDIVVVRAEGALRLNNFPHELRKIR